MEYKYALGSRVVLVDGGFARIDRVILQRLAPQPVYHVAHEGEDVHNVTVVQEDQIKGSA